MEKGYFIIKPSDFSRLGRVDINGNYKKVNCKDFNVSNPSMNYLVFEYGYTDRLGERTYSKTAREVITGRIFKLLVSTNKRISCPGEKKVDYAITMQNNELGLFTNGPLKASNIECKKSKAAGLLSYIGEDKMRSQQYCSELKEMVEEASAYKYMYNHTVNGPSRYLTSSIKKEYKRL